ncbi:hypothetical protein IPZ60_01240 [Psychrobacter sp. NG25]|uniref:hypothetical protein n=1 Tax=Psychrobacter sp. NG25 TaxID=2782005 RepID=UPI001883A7A0|nr:hypothetical protein [Psychrobacter sp. NG25]
MTSHQKKSGAAVLLLALLTGCSSGSNMQEQSTSTIQQEKSIQTDSVAERSIQDAAESERLGTKWGDDVNSEVTTVDLRRTNPEPIEQMQVRYADKSYTGRAVNSMSLLAGKVEFSAATDAGKLSLYRNAGNYYLQGQAGQAYRLVYHNNSANTYEIVASVDGLNVLDGSAASRYDSGYVLEPNDDLVIEGFRKSQSSVASFIFSKPDDAYAANTQSGSISNTGVIGTAIYELYDPTKPKPQQPQAYPADNGYAKPPQ